MMEQKIIIGLCDKKTIVLIGTVEKWHEKYLALHEAYLNDGDALIIDKIIIKPNLN